MKKVLALLASSVLLVTAPGASAATDFGALAATEECSSTGVLAWITGSPYVVPGKGVVTVLKGAAGSGPATFALKVVRPGASPHILGTTPVQNVADPGGSVSVPVRIPVEAGDVLGIWLGNDYRCAGADTPTDVPFQGVESGDQGVGPVAGTVVSGTDIGQFISLGATWEADADGDGFGDESQDGCPTDAAITTGPCTVDAVLSASGAPATVEVGDVAVISASVVAPGPGLTRAVTLNAAVPEGLSPLFAFPAACAPSALMSCSLGDVGSTPTGFVVALSATTPGQYSIPLSITSPNDPNAANNTASVPITVVPKTTPVSCRVPSLKSQTKAFAKRLLEAARCKLGKTKTKSVKKGKTGIVSTQSTKAGTVLAVGAAVDITITKRAKAKRKKR